jgi:hypothetical protein
MPSVTPRVARSRPAAAATFPPPPPVTRPTNQLAANAAPPARARTVATVATLRSTAEQNDRSRDMTAPCLGSVSHFRQKATARRSVLLPPQEMHVEGG